MANGGGENPFYPQTYVSSTSSNITTGQYKLWDTSDTLVPHWKDQQSGQGWNAQTHPLDRPVGPVRGLDEMAALLHVEPSGMVMGELILMAESGKMFRFFDILQAQVDMMANLHMLLVHEGK